MSSSHHHYNPHHHRSHHQQHDSSSGNVMYSSSTAAGSSVTPTGSVTSTPTTTTSATSNNATPTTTTSNSTSSNNNNNNGKGGEDSNSFMALWDLDMDPLTTWAHTVPVLFPVQDNNNTDNNNNTTSSSKMNKKGKSNTAPTPTPATSSTVTSEETVQKLNIANTLWKNLQVALNGLHSIEEAIKSEDEPANKRIKTENGSASASNSSKNENFTRNFSQMRKQQQLKQQEKIIKKKKKRTTKITIIDPYNIWLHTLRKHNEEMNKKNANNDDQQQQQKELDEDEREAQLEEYENAAEEIKTGAGGKLSQMGVSGIMNGMSGRLGGVVKTRQCEMIPGSIDDKTGKIPTAYNLTFLQLKNYATAFYTAVQTRIEADVLVTTPIRIQQMLAPDLLAHEFKAIRRRIYDTVILGKGLANPGLNDTSDIPTAASGGVHDIEKFKKCKSCGNNDQSLFVLDRKNGDVICSSCGTVVSESLMHEGSQFRKFEGEVDRNHHGDTANPLYSNAHNMSTTLGGVQMTTGAGIGGFGSQAKRGLETVLRNAHAYTELNISQFGKGDRRTRTGYKDKQKKDAFIQMTHAGDALNLHEAVVQRAKELFAGFRDDRELVQQFKGVIAACLCEAFDQLSTAGKQILKQKAEDPVTSTTSTEEKKYSSNSRASRRNELHHANLAGKGGLWLDFSAVPHHNKKDKSSLSSTTITPSSSSTPPPSAGSGGNGSNNQASSPTSGTVSEKVCSRWDLDDCRSWLLEASRSIAEQWLIDRNNGNTKIPMGTKAELEGQLVEHAITLCDQLELDLQQKNNISGKGGRRAVVTPRVTDMAKLGIKWQHAHERGSGGKGGVGNNLQSVAARKRLQLQQRKKDGNNSKTSSSSAKAGGSGAGGGGQRTAGQLLILKTAKKLGLMLKDPVAGEAIHKELRTLVGKQEARKRKEMREEATRQRFLQMKRKPWLQARAQIET